MIEEPSKLRYPNMRGELMQASWRLAHERYPFEGYWDYSEDMEFIAGDLHPAEPERLLGVVLLTRGEIATYLVLVEAIKAVPDSGGRALGIVLWPLATSRKSPTQVHDRNKRHDGTEDHEQFGGR